MKSFMQLILAALFTFSLAACSDDANTPAEKVSESMEAAADTCADAVYNDGAMEEAGEDMKDAAEDAGEKMDAMAEDLKG